MLALTTVHVRVPYGVGNIIRGARLLMYNLIFGHMPMLFHGIRTRISSFEYNVQSFSKVHLSIYRNRATLLRFILRHTRGWDPSGHRGIISILKITRQIIGNHTNRPMRRISNSFRHLYRNFYLTEIVRVLHGFSSRRLLNLIMLAVLCVGARIRRISRLLNMLTGMVRNHY